ncbi:hypothetical protein CDD81_6495 [Ophiocordyceps australis]|uniref:Carrier domain-containing protein n=1 Tax=Ophiocordyceps australis TaxID=1399860 RepID=A0A2C5XLW1_9HYPO|nr:hypothetical protein CDD81_6495 [Ophiocordyceps australis]
MDNEPPFLPPTQAHRDLVHGALKLLKNRLPAYMVPDVVIPLPYIPLSYQPRLAAKRPPETESEAVLQTIVAEVLKLHPSDVGMDDGFFRLGGDSIIAIRLVERAQSQGFAFRVSNVFESPKLADLARFASRCNGNDLHVSEDSAQSLQLLMDSADPEKVAHNLVSQGFSCSEHDIVQVLPMTQAAERFLFQTPEYWIVNLQGPVNLDRLQEACTALVVLEHVDTSFKFYGTSQSIADSVDEYRLSDLLPLPTLNMLMTEFIMVQNIGGQDVKQALVVRLSHAQFDGVSLHTLWRDLKHLYEDTSLPAATPYSHHLQQWRRSNYSFGDSPQDSPDVFVTGTRFVNIGQSIPRNITTATIVKTAWATLLAKLTGSSDCVFAQISNGRNYDSSAAYNVVGACLNFIPVRANLNPTWTVLQLLEFMQQQHSASLAHELLDFGDIVQRSTPWPTGTAHQSVVLHQNIEPDQVFQFGDAEAWVTCSYEWPHPPDEILVESLPTGNASLRVTLDTRSSTLSRRNVNLVLEKLCRLIVLLPALADNADASVETLLAALD